MIPAMIPATIETMEARGMDAGMDPAEISAPLPSATVLLLRDGADGLEVFMVERSGRVGAFAGAMVFPGGKVAPEDSSAELRALADNAESLDDEAFGFAVSSVREAFEECGVLLAHREGRDADRRRTGAACRLPRRDRPQPGALRPLSRRPRLAPRHGRVGALFPLGDAGVPAQAVRYDVLSSPPCRPTRR